MQPSAPARPAPTHATPTRRYAGSLLGPDFCGTIQHPASPTAPGGGASSTSDNQHHKDHHGDHRLRHITYFYYPREVTLDMG